MKARLLAGAVALSGVALLGVATAAAAQTYNENQTAGTSDSTVTPGQTFTADSGSGAFEPGAEPEVRVLGNGFNAPCQASPADSTGNVEARCTVPEDARPGRAEVRFGDRVSVPFTVVAGAAASPGRGQLPRTGAESITELTAAGVALVIAGAGVVFVARRRRSDLPAGMA